MHHVTTSFTASAEPKQIFAATAPQRLFVVIRSSFIANISQMSFARGGLATTSYSSRQAIPGPAQACRLTLHMSASRCSVKVFAAATVPFSKFQGLGNDFLLVRAHSLLWRLCARDHPSRTAKPHCCSEPAISADVRAGRQQTSVTACNYS